MSGSAGVDALVLGGGPAALCISAELGAQGLDVALMSLRDPRAPWQNTFGIWGEEVDQLGLQHLLGHRWSNTVSWFGSGRVGDEGRLGHGRDYGLFDKAALQQHWLDAITRDGACCIEAQAQSLSHDSDGSTITTSDGAAHHARIVIDATGHEPVFLQRPSDGLVAGQAAYGVVGRFSQEPVEQGQFVLMDYRSDHLSEEQRQGPPTFLYAMDLGGGRFFVEETSLALAPALPYGELERRLHQRLNHRGIAIEAVEHVEYCLFPMNPALPELSQQLLGFGGSASMVHPASGYMVGSLLRRGPLLAAALAEAINDGQRGRDLAQAGWGNLWPAELRRRHGLYRFGLEKLMRFDEAQLRDFFSAFFSLPNERWFGFLANTLPTPELLNTMLQLFGGSSNPVRWGLMQPRGRELSLMAKMLQW